MLMNLRNALMAGKRTPTAKDYVQNGLVAMWDGIENAGWGTHDASATTWKDLIGGIETSWLTNVADNSLTWENGGLRRIGTKGITATVPWCANIVQTTPYTLEIVMSDSSQALSSTSQNYYYSSMSNTLIFSRPNHAELYDSTGNVYHRIGPKNYGFEKTGFSFVATGDVATNNRTYVKIFSNGSIIVDGGLMSALNVQTFEFFRYSRDWPNTRDTTFYRVALYSRALTAAEIAANYAIDNARFGLQ